MILEPVDGNPIDRTSLMVPRSGLMSSFLMVKFLGRYSKNMMIEKVSDMMLIRIYPMTAIRVPYFINFGKISRTTSSLNSCSRMFDTEWGIICCLPKQYPLIILDNSYVKNVKDAVSEGYCIPGGHSFKINTPLEFTYGSYYNYSLNIYFHEEDY